MQTYPDVSDDKCEQVTAFAVLFPCGQTAHSFGGLDESLFQSVDVLFVAFHEQSHDTHLAHVETFDSGYVKLFKSIDYTLKNGSGSGLQSLTFKR